jgi:hypothetical protein
MCTKALIMAAEGPWAVDARTGWCAKGIEPERQAGVRSIPQGHALGKGSWRAIDDDNCNRRHRRLDLK